MTYCTPLGLYVPKSENDGDENCGDGSTLEECLAFFESNIFLCIQVHLGFSMCDYFAHSELICPKGGRNTPFQGL